MNQISHADFEGVLQQLVNLEEKEEELVQELYPDPSPERTHFQKLLGGYINSLDKFLKKATVVKKKTPFPLVILESTAEAKEIETGEVYRFRLVLPFQGGLSDVSVLSPLGQAFLLKRPGDTIVVKAPGGVFHYQILAVHFQKES